MRKIFCYHCFKHVFFGSLKNGFKKHLNTRFHQNLWRIHVLMSEEDICLTNPDINVKLNDKSTANICH
jgi:hypothetical protein